MKTIQMFALCLIQINNFNEAKFVLWYNIVNKTYQGPLWINVLSFPGIIKTFSIFMQLGIGGWPIGKKYVIVWAEGNSFCVQLNSLVIVSFCKCIIAFLCQLTECTFIISRYIMDIIIVHLKKKANYMLKTNERKSTYLNSI